MSVTLAKFSAWSLVGGWLAVSLASTDPDVDRSIEAYGNKDYAAAQEALELAKERRGDLPELMLNQGLYQLGAGQKEAAPKSFERGSESEHDQVRASAFYSLGNLAFDAKDWDGAIEAYKKCLRAMPEHSAAKWNLELALARKKQQEEDEKKKQDQDKDKKNSGGDNSDEEKSEEEKSDEEKSEEEKSDEEKSDEEKSEDEKSEDKKSDEEKSQEEKSGEEKSEQEKSEEKKSQDSQSGEEEKSEEEKSQEQKSQGAQEGQDESEKKEEKPAAPVAPPQAIDKADMDKALEELDNQDSFIFGKPRRRIRVKRDW